MCVTEVKNAANHRVLTPILDRFLYISRPREHYWAALNKENEKFVVVRSQHTAFLQCGWVGLP